MKVLENFNKYLKNLRKLNFFLLSRLTAGWDPCAIFYFSFNFPGFLLGGRSPVPPLWQRPWTAISATHKYNFALYCKSVPVHYCNSLYCCRTYGYAVSLPDLTGSNSHLMLCHRRFLMRSAANSRLRLKRESRLRALGLMRNLIELSRRYLKNFDIDIERELIQ